VDLGQKRNGAVMPKKSTKKPIQLDREDSTEELSESMILGVTTDGECVYIHTFDNDIQALEFLETAAAGLRADILSSMYKRSMN
jgi:ribosomal protein S8E